MKAKFEQIIKTPVMGKQELEEDLKRNGFLFVMIEECDQETESEKMFRIILSSSLVLNKKEDVFNLSKGQDVEYLSNQDLAKNGEV